MIGQERGGVEAGHVTVCLPWVQSAGIADSLISRVNELSHFVKSMSIGINRFQELSHTSPSSLVAATMSGNRSAPMKLGMFVALGNYRTTYSQ